MEQVKLMTNSVRTLSDKELIRRIDAEFNELPASIREMYERFERTVETVYDKEGLLSQLQAVLEPIDDSSELIDRMQEDAQSLQTLIEGYLEQVKKVQEIIAEAGK
jgi:methyl-accepting chemotaxis protein